MAETREIQKKSRAQKEGGPNPRVKRRSPKADTECKLRPSAIELKHDAKQRLPEYCRLNALFHDQEKMDATLNELLTLCPDSQKDLLFEWLAQSPLELNPQSWDPGRVPSFLKY